jgi:histidyl-tRNA synthetase
MRDILPGERQTLLQLQERLEAVLEHHGYAPIDLPIVEHRSLYLRKQGEELVGKVYEFNFGGRELALRPEWTASVLRLYANHLQDQPLPMRLRYTGPVFRYERPQRSTYRQFTQLGTELIGGTAPRADAEVVALACSGLDAVGITDYHVTLGHIGLVREILVQLGLAERTQGLLLWRLERMRTQGIETVRDYLNEQQGELPLDPRLLDGMDDTQATDFLLRMLQEMRVSLSFGTRSPDAIVSRLVRKMRRDDPQPIIERALELLMRISQVRGPAAQAFAQMAALLDESGLHITALNEIQTILTLLNAHNIPSERLVLDFGLSRGLHYYTGLIFEIYDAEEFQLCGGGRYDDLVQALGGQQLVPAAGFAYGLERVAAALDQHAPPAKPQRDVLVVPVTDDDYPYAVQVAERLRQHGFVATLDVRGRSVNSNLRDAARRGSAYVAIVGVEEREQHMVVWRDLAQHEEQRLSIEALPT